MKGITLNTDLHISPRTLPDGGITGFKIDDITYQNQYSILVAYPGEYKHSPTKGIGIDSYLDDESPEELFMEIRTQLTSEGMQVKKVGFNERSKLEIEAGYTK